MKVVIIGAGMSGLSAAFLLNRQGIDIEVLESCDVIGGASHSFEWSGHICDWSTHRLFTTNEHVLQQLESLVPMNRVERTSAIMLGGKWMHDPIDVTQICARFASKTLSVPWDYITRPRNLPETSFQNYVYAKFGRSLSDFMFSPYTVKMFGIPPEEITVEWARKKVRIASPLDVIRQGSKKKFNYFYYPKENGWGAIPDAMYSEIKDKVVKEATVTGLEVEDNKIKAVVYEKDGKEQKATGDIVISTLELTKLCKMLNFDTPLRYRAVSAVYLKVNRPQVTPNHWIYYMDGDIAINRLCEFKNFDPKMGPAETAVVCAEVTDNHYPNLVDKVIGDLEKTGVLKKEEVLDSTIITRDCAYAVYYCNYEKDVADARKFIGNFSNLHSLGRAAQYEHMEIDDCFSAAMQLVKELTTPETAPEAKKKRSDLSVEPLVANVVVANENIEENIECIKSILASNYGQTKTALVITPSATELEKMITTEFSSVEILKRPEDMGTPAAFNIGANWASKQEADFVFFSLANTEVDPEAITELTSVAQRDPEAGILTPKILSFEDKNTIWSIGTQFRKFPPAIKTIGSGQKDSEKFNEKLEIEFAVSSGLFVKMEVFEKIGLFDPGYQFYYEDMDFSKRVRDAGFRIRYVPTSKMYHKKETQTRDAEFFRVWGESFSRYYRRHKKPLVLTWSIHLLYLLTREAATGNAGHVADLYKGAFKGVHHNISEPPKLGDEFIDVKL
ncbi:MAG: FAD-dependent oxidoreductase [Kiritimatiellae bacterium]|nr:FAD-dependent oxidoreductase [Kiritimatiellia bacterium]